MKTAADITSLVRIHFSKKQIKLFKNEPHKKFINGRLRCVKNMGFPFGSSDTVGWRTGDGKICFVEIKTVNDTLAKKQKDFLDLIIKDGGMGFVAKENKKDEIILTNWATGEKEII